jgi:hypothetical protein
VTDLLDRAPAHAVMEKLASLRGTPDLRELPFGIVRISKNGLSWLRGVRGELDMAKRLRKLGDEWTVLHSIPIGSRESDIDHLVVGPTGVFPINTKRLVDRRVWVARGRMLIDGNKRDYLRNSEYEAARVERVLRAAGMVAPVVPVIAISRAKSLTIKATPEWNGRKIGVALVGDVVRRIKRREPRLSPAQVGQIVVLLRDSRSWTSREFERSNGAEIRAVYEHIDRGISRWNLLISALTLLVACLGVTASVGVWAILH